MATDSLDFSWSQPNVSENRRASSFIFVKEAEDKSTPVLLSWLAACVWNSCKRNPRSATTCKPTAKQSLRSTQRDARQATLSLHRQKPYTRAGNSYIPIAHNCNKHQEVFQKVLFWQTGRKIYVYKENQFLKVMAPPTLSPIVGSSKSSPSLKSNFYISVVVWFSFSQYYMEGAHFIQPVNFQGQAKARSSLLPTWYINTKSPLCQQNICSQMLLSFI